MSFELNTLASKKWVANYSGGTPTIDITDGVLIGDFAIDTSNNEAWRCYGNTNGSPKWIKDFVEVDMQSIQPTLSQTTSSWPSFALLAGSTLTATGARTKKYRLQLDCKVSANATSTYLYMGFYVNSVSQYSGVPLYMGITNSGNTFSGQPMGWCLIT